VSAAALIAELQLGGAEIRVVDSSLSVRAARSVLTPALVARVQEMKRELVAELRREAQPRRGRAGELVIPFGAPERFRWWEASQPEERRRRFRLARQAAGIGS
jgi:hypothetical protein